MNGFGIDSQKVATVQDCLEAANERKVAGAADGAEKSGVDAKTVMLLLKELSNRVSLSLDSGRLQQPYLQLDGGHVLIWALIVDFLSVGTTH